MSLACFGWLGGIRNAGPLLLAVLGGFGACFFLGLLDFWKARRAREFVRVFGGLVVGPEGHAVLPLHPAHLVSLLV